MENIKTDKLRLSGNLKFYKKIIITFLFSILLYIIAAFNNNVFLHFISEADYLTWHVIFEFASILVAFSIFTVTYFVYEESGMLSFIVLGCSFFLMGLLDAFHTFTFKGMSDFFVSNTTANRATTLWTFSRGFGSLGFLLSVLIPKSTISKINKNIFAGITFSFSVLLFILVTYFPKVFPPMYIESTGLTRIKIIVEYLIILIMIITFIVVLREYKSTSHRREHQFMISLIFLIFSESAFTNYGSVYDAFNYIGHIYKIIAYIILYKAIYIENISEPYREMKKARQELKEYSNNLNLIVKQRTKELEEVNVKLLNDIEYAKEIQLSLMPTQMPENPSVSFYAEYLAAEHLSGDFYNVIKLDEKNIAIYLGDVAGHGVSAAMLTVFANQNIIPLKEDEDKSVNIIPPKMVLDYIYKEFNNTNFSDETYFLMLYGIYNTETKLFTYSSAGINVSPYIIKSSGEIIELNSKGFSICKLGEYLKPSYKDREIQLEKGDKLVLYSDGLIESKNLNNEIYGQDKMNKFLRNNHNLSAEDLGLSIKRDLHDHIGHIERIKDDVTILIMEVK
ncbi:MAG: MASE3 domain-containing protein [Tissierellaceae bacterium]|nr:MASE3 domain-containing protein [Tissierellaceae bacterium]